jgi:RES domain-containing protein
VPLPRHSSRELTSEVSVARRKAWAEIITDEKRVSRRRSMTAWHHGSPRRDVLDLPDPPTHGGRYNRAGARATWYGSSTEAGTWAEFARSLPPGANPAEFQRRLGQVHFDLEVLDLTSPALQRRLRVDQSELVSDDLEVCETLADLALEAGYAAVLGPSAAAAGETTLAVFGPALVDKANRVVDHGVRTPPIPR